MQTTVSDFVAVGIHSPSPKYFWKGSLLSEVQRMAALVDDDTNHIKLYVLDTDTYESVYAEMVSAGIQIKKVRS